MARRAGGRRLPLFGLEEMRKETVGHEAEYVPNGFVTDGCPVDSHCLIKPVSPWVGGWVIVHPVSLYRLAVIERLAAHPSIIDFAITLLSQVEQYFPVNRDFQYCCIIFLSCCVLALRRACIERAVPKHEERCPTLASRQSAAARRVRKVARASCWRRPTLPMRVPYR